MRNVKAIFLLFNEYLQEARVGVRNKNKKNCGELHVWFLSCKK